MTNQNLSESKKLKGGSLVASKTTISGAVLRVALALALVLGLMPSLGNTVAFANETGSKASLSGEASSADSWTADDFTYDETDKSTITGLSDSGKAKIVKNTEVVIPATKTDGTAITAIGNDSTTDNLFKATVDSQTYEATKVTIPEGVTSIGKMAFKAYAGESITLPSTLTTIGMAAFQGSKLTSIVIPTA